MRFNSTDRTMQIQCEVKLTNGWIESFNQRTLFEYSVTEQCATQGYALGEAPAAGYTLVFNNTAHRHEASEYLGAEVTTTLSIKDGNSWVSYPFGKWYVQTATLSRQNVRGTLTGMDALGVKFGLAYTDTATYPRTLRQILQQMCSLAGVTLATPYFTNSNVSVAEMPRWGENISIRQVVAYVAAAAGGIARINRSGNLEIMEFGSGSVYGETITPDTFRTMDTDDGATFAFNTLQVRYVNPDATAQTEEFTRYAVDETLIDTAFNTLQVDMNPLFTEAIALRLKSALTGMTSRTMHLDWVGDPTIMPGTKITVEDVDGSEYTIIVNNQTITYMGGLEAQTSAALATNVPYSSGYTPGGGLLTPDGYLLGDKVFPGSIKAGQLDVQQIFASEAFIDQLNAADITANESLRLYVPNSLDTGDEGVMVEINKDSFNVTVSGNEGSFNVNVPGENGNLRLDADGGHFSKAIIGELVCDNIPGLYRGKTDITVGTDTSDYLTLQQAFDALNNGTLESNVRITVEGDLCEKCRIAGLSGGGELDIVGGGHTLTGSIIALNNALTVDIEGLTIANDGERSAAIIAYGNTYLNAHDCDLDANGEAFAVYTGKGTNMRLSDCNLYNASTAIYAGAGTQLTAKDLGGGSASAPFLVASGCTVRMSGKRPEGTATIDPDVIIVPADPTTLPTDSGGSTPVVTPTTNATLACIRSRTHTGGTSWESANTVIQGRYDTTNYAGCMWFNTSAITGKTIRAASISLTRLGGWGTWQETSVSICTTTLASASGSPLPGSGTPKVIGSILEGETKTFAIPVDMVQALADGTANALMLYISSDPTLSGKVYSANFSAFAGFGSSGVPELKVTYNT